MSALISTQYGPLANSASSASKKITGVVVSVLDGDSVKIKSGTEFFQIELSGIDAPEPGQNFGQHSGRYLSDLVGNRTVILEMQQPDQDGTLYGELFLDGVSINKLLLKDGFAWAVRGKSEYRTWIGLEKIARDGAYGLWRYENAIAPWEYQRQILAGLNPEN